MYLKKLKIGNVELSYKAETSDKRYIINYYEFDGEVSQILNTALPIYIENTIYSYVLDSKATLKGR